MKAYIAPLMTIMTLLLLMFITSQLAPSIVTASMLISFCFSLLKVLTVLAVARLALTYLDNRLGMSVNEFIRSTANAHDKAMYFSARFVAVLFVFGFIMA